MKKETIASLKAQLEQKDKVILGLRNEKHEAILRLEQQVAEFNGLKTSFDMVKKNYEREKNRLDGVIKTMFNQSKPVKATHFAYNNEPK
jgi:hypothetical protein